MTNEEFNFIRGMQNFLQKHRFDASALWTASVLRLNENDGQERKWEDGKGGRNKKMKGRTSVDQEEVGLREEGKEEKNKREDSWLIAEVHHFGVAVNGRQPLLC